VFRSPETFLLQFREEEEEEEEEEGEGKGGEGEEGRGGEKEEEEEEGFDRKHVEKDVESTTISAESFSRPLNVPRMDSRGRNGACQRRIGRNVLDDDVLFPQKEIAGHRIPE